jgi:TRAP transporter TAXI family solute receptor
MKNRAFSATWAPRVCATLLATFALGACSQGEGGTRRFLSLGTAGTGGVYYVLGGALASRLSLKDPGRQYTAEVTGGSVENVNRIREGQIDLAFALSGTAYEAYHGGEDYAQPVTGLRVLAPLYPNITHVLVRGVSSIQSLADLKGTRVSVGAAGSGTEQHSRHLLGTIGITYDDITPLYLSFNESAAALADGSIDAAIISVGYPAAAVLEATTTANARLIGVAPQELEALRTRYPYYDVGSIPAGLYRGVTEAIPTVATMNWLVAQESLESDVVRALLDVLEDERDALIRAHESAEQIDLADLAESPIPLHPAVLEWWRERRGSDLVTGSR